MGETSAVFRRLRAAALFSVGAGVVHGAAVGIHAGHPVLVRIFVVCTLLQVGWGVVALERGGRRVAMAGALINGAAVLGWIITRTKGISFIPGLETAETPQAADTLCALLGALAAFAAWAGTVPTIASSRRRAPSFVVALMLTTAGLATVREHQHSHDEEQAAESAFVVDANGALVLKTSTTDVPVAVATTTTVPDGKVSKALAGTVPVTTSVTTLPKKKVPVVTTVPAPDTTVHSHVTTPAAQLAAASGWPRVWDPARGLDIMTGVGGVTADQEARAKALVSSALTNLPKWADYATAVAAGWKSIADNQTAGFEHLVNQSLVNDGRFLDTTAPESLVYEVKNGTKTLVSAMFISPTGTSITDPLLTDYAGPLMQWHIHNNLCFKFNAAGNPIVAAITNIIGECPVGTFKQTNGSPMVHVWITPNPCGPFAAVEGVAAGTAAVPDSQRLDLCNASH